MALPNTDFGAGRPATKAETFGTKTGADTEVVKGLEDIEDVIDKRLETISLFVEKIANYIPKLGGIEYHVKQISGSNEFGIKDYLLELIFRCRKNKLKSEKLIKIYNEYEC